MVEIATAVIGAFVAIYIAKLDKKTKAIHREVTVNHHSSDQPTIKDKLDDIQKLILEHLAWHDRQER